MSSALLRNWDGDSRDVWGFAESLHKILDLDLAVIEAAYQSEYMARQQRIEQLAAIGQVSGGVAHELRNPLNVIRTSIYYLLHTRELSAKKQREHLTRIDRQVKQADGVITALTGFAKLPVPDMRLFSIPECLDESLEAVSFPKTIQVGVQSSDGLPAAVADQRQIQIVFANLLQNAGDAMPNGGELNIRADHGDGMIHVDVADSGHGIPSSDLGRILEPFYTTKTRGIGLGLAIARAIMEKNQGQLSVSSELNRGSTFTVRLRACKK